MNGFSMKKEKKKTFIDLTENGYIECVVEINVRKKAPVHVF